MIIQNRFLHAPDTATGDAPAVDIPVVPAGPSPSTFTEVDLTPKPQKVDVAAALGIKEGGIKGPQDIFGPDESSDASNAKLDAMGRKHGEDGKFVAKEGTDLKPKPAAKPAAKAAPKAAPAAEPTTPAEPKIKLKIGDTDVEKTASEWQQYFEQQAKPPEPKKEEPTPGAGQDGPDDEAAERAAEEKFISESAERLAPSQEEFDKVLADGDRLGMGRMLARVLMTAQKWMANSVNPHLERLDGQLSPLAQQQQEVQALQTEVKFLNDHPDIKAITDDDPTKREIHREICGKLSEELMAREKFATDNPELEWAKDEVDRIKKDFLGEVAARARIKLGITASAPTPAMPEPQKVAPAAKAAPTERPLGGDRPGAAAAPKILSNEARLAAEVAAL